LPAMQVIRKHLFAVFGLKMRRTFKIIVQSCGILGLRQD